MKTDNFWTETAKFPGSLPGSELPARTDVAVVGGGYTGLHAALALRKAGVDVTVLEKETIGWGASSRNGGMLTPGLKASAKNIVRWYGAEQGKVFWDWAWEAIDHVRETVESERIDCDFDYRGFAALMYRPEHLGQWDSYMSFLKQHFGFEGYRRVTQGELRSEIGSDSYHGAYVGEHAAGLQPARYVFGLGLAAARRGAVLLENTEVRRIDRQQGGFEVHTPAGVLHAGEVLLATNGYTTAGPLPGARDGIFPIGSYIITTEQLPADLQGELSPRGRMFYDSKWFLNYFRLTPDGRMLFGGRNNLSTGLDLEESARRLQTRMLEVFPQLAGCRLTHSWTGKLGVTFDLMPHVGRINGVHYAYGYGGHGVSIASKLGKEVGELLAGVRTDSPFLHIRHPRTFVARFEKLFLPFVEKYFRIIDRFS